MVDLVGYQQACTSFHLGERKKKKKKKPLKTMQKIQCISGKKSHFTFQSVLHIILNPPHWLSLTPEHKSAASECQLFHLNGTKGLCRFLVCVYQYIEPCIRKQNLKPCPDRAQRQYPFLCLKATCTATNFFLLL